MKKLFILIALSSIALLNAHAQTEKGDQNLGLTFSFNANSGSFNYLNVNQIASDNGSTQNTTFSTNPVYSYFIANNTDIGASIGYGRGTYNTGDKSQGLISKDVQKNYFASIYARKYFLYNNRIGIRTGPFLSYQYYSSRTTYPPNSSVANYTSNGTTYNGGIIADFVYYPSKKVGLAVNLGSLSYTHGKSNGTQQGTNNNGVNLQFLNNNLMLSVLYVLGN